MAVYLNDMFIDSYRGIRKLKIQDLGDINILVGDNNAGKTSVLECIQLLGTPSVYNLVQVARQREQHTRPLRYGLSIYDAVRFLFDMGSKQDEENNIRIEFSLDGKEIELIIKAKEFEQMIDTWEVRSQMGLSVIGKKDQGIMEEVNTFFVEMETRRNGKVEMQDEVTLYEPISYLQNKRKNQFIKVKTVKTYDYLDTSINDIIKNSSAREQAIELLQKFDKNVKDIRYIGDERRVAPMIESQSGNYIPLSAYGDGMRKTLSMLNALLNAAGGIVTIDEFETAIHISAMTNVFSSLIKVANGLNIQLFLTTHSIEAVDKFLENAGENLEKVRVIRLKKKNNVTFAKVLNGVEALNNRRDYNMEFRI